MRMKPSTSMTTDLLLIRQSSSEGMTRPSCHKDQVVCLRCLHGQGLSSNRAFKSHKQLQSFTQQIEVLRIGSISTSEQHKFCLTQLDRTPSCSQQLVAKTSLQYPSSIRQTLASIKHIVMYNMSHSKPTPGCHLLPCHIQCHRYHNMLHHRTRVCRN